MNKLEVRIKNLKSQLAKYMGEASALKMEVSNKQRELQSKTKAVDTLQRELKKLENNSGVSVTDHAILRYFERVKGFDIAAIKLEILHPSVLTMIDTLGGGELPHPDGYSLKVKNNSVITIITKDKINGQ